MVFGVESKSGYPIGVSSNLPGVLWVSIEISAYKIERGFPEELRYLGCVKLPFWYVSNVKEEILEIVKIRFLIY